ncbi:unnamed protein product [Rotaria sp. Silwood2]|nr:unnamed protein product [Rotaria sp. Silwood2]CAF2971714.1 unnamed protein product [Rotaria sp. Silwood2]CAF3164900.1 unnamed protein product [Rotaria sp. Silwood2]CAF4082638.1 unnamed protein product [Rotaria sp. Silwood2]CAF4342190.1 unnamed protein product [Rotaria sp. Silwood2]
MIIETKIYSFDAEVTLTQIFRNEKNISVETFYCFPTKITSGIIDSFLARIDDRNIVHIKDVVTNDNDGLHLDDSFCSFEHYEKLKENFIFTIGSLSSSQECTIYITYHNKLKCLSSSNIQLIIPMIIAP